MKGRGLLTWGGGGGWARGREGGRMEGGEMVRQIQRQTPAHPHMPQQGLSSKTSNLALSAAKPIPRTHDDTQPDTQSRFESTERGGRDTGGGAR